MTSPIRPEDIVKTVPDEVIQVFNEMISEAWDGNSATLKQNDVAPRIADRMECSRAHVFKKGWLDIESLFRDAGWEVEYDKPGYNESYGAAFTFRWAKP